MSAKTFSPGEVRILAAVFIGGWGTCTLFIAKYFYTDIATSIAVGALSSGLILLLATAVVRGLRGDNPHEDPSTEVKTGFADQSSTKVRTSFTDQHHQRLLRSRTASFDQLSQWAAKKFSLTAAQMGLVMRARSAKRLIDEVVLSTPWPMGEGTRRFMDGDERVDIPIRSLLEHASEFNSSFRLPPREHSALEVQNAINAFYDTHANVDYCLVRHADDGFGPRNGTQSLAPEIPIRALRALVSMTDREIAVLRYNQLLYSAGLLEFEQFFSIKKSLISNGGKSLLRFVGPDNDDVERSETVAGSYRVSIAKSQRGFEDPETAISFFLTAFGDIAQKHPEHALVREFQSRILAGGGWLSDDELAASVYRDSEQYSLYLGVTECDRPVRLGGDGSLITVAPPGSGKTQCHVLPNLLTYPGPMMVLDIKGECFERTSSWRKHNVGPVFKFNPLAPEESARYNPLSLLSNDPDVLWEDCRLMADLLIVPENQQDPSWENRARDVVAGALAWLVHKKPPDSRSMGAILDIVARVSWDAFLRESQYAVELPALRRLANALAVMPDRQLEGVLDAARRHLAVWEGGRVERATAACDWTPELLRNGSSPTVYICIPPNEIESYAPLMRVLFAQHLRKLMSALPQATHKPIVFMLDELPRLGPMKPIEEALEVGRQYGIRLWMFAQSLGQLQKSYTNAEGMIGSCAARIFMNPSAHDGTAKRLSEELGYTESVIDRSRHLLVEASALAGPAYADRQLLLSRGTRPLKLRKQFAYNDPVLQSRLS